MALSSPDCISSVVYSYSVRAGFSFSFWLEKKEHPVSSKQKIAKLYFRIIIQPFVFSVPKILLFGFSSNKLPLLPLDISCCFLQIGHSFPCVKQVQNMFVFGFAMVDG